MELIYIILMFCIPMYFICRWVMYKRKIGNSKKRWMIALIPTAILTPIIVCLSIFIILVSIAYIPNKKFTKNRWDKNTEKRYMLSKNIIDKKILIDKTPKEVIELLGDKEQYTIKNDSIYQITYYLGVKGLMGANWYYLDIFIEKERVVRVNQIKDNGSIEYRLKKQQYPSIEESNN